MDAPKRTLTTKLSPEELSRFAAAKIKRHECPRCGNSKWVLPDESAGSIDTIGLTILDDQKSPTGLYATVVFECGDCGFVALHAKNVVVSWLNEHD